MKSLFRISREEWPSGGVALVVLVVLHYLMVSKFWSLFADYSEAHFDQFSRNYHMSGFDYYTYGVVTDWSMAFDIFRHPLLAWMYYPVYLVNKVLWTATGANCAQLLVAVILLFCGFYSFIFLRRTLRLGSLSNACSSLLSLMFLCFGYVMVTMIVADHFCLSLFMLTLTLYLSRKKMLEGRTFTVTQTVFLFIVTSGITLSNGALTLLIVLFTNGRSFFRKRFLAMGVIIPSLLMAVLAFSLTRIYSTDYDNATSTIEAQMKWTEKGRDQRLAILQGNFFGESLQLHRHNVLGDVMSGTRSLVEKYTWPAQNYVEILLELLMLAGAIMGRRNRFAWLLMGILLFNLLLHIVIGFAISEVHIMTAHWAFVIPLLMGYLFVPEEASANTNDCAYIYKYNKVINTILFLLLTVLTLYLFLYHFYLLHRYLTWPLG